MAVVFLPLAAVEEHVKLRTKKLRLSVNKFPAAASLCVNFICQNFDQSWSRLSFVGGGTEIGNTLRGKEAQNFCKSIWIFFLNRVA